MRINTIFSTFLFIIFFGLSNINGQIFKNKEVTDLIEKKRDYNKKNGFGFRIQLLYEKEDKIREILDEFSLVYPEIKTYIHYDKPFWKAQVGDYKTRLNADKDLNKFKKKFPSAIVVPK